MHRPAEVQLSARLANPDVALPPPGSPMQGDTFISAGGGDLLEGGGTAQHVVAPRAADGGD